MKHFLAILLALPAFGAVSGTVVNQTTGTPQAGAAVELDKLGQNGPEQVAETKADAQGRFSIAQDAQGQMPYLLRTEYDGIRYFHMIPPGTPTTGITVNVYGASRSQGEAKVSKHMILFQPGAGKLGVSETYIVENGGKSAWNDPKQGTVQFYLPAGADGNAQIQATEPGGMPISAEVVKTGKSGLYGVDFAIKPGETRIDVNYSLPYTAGAPYSGKIATRDDNTYLIAPNGVTLDAKGLTDLGTEPRTQAHIYGLAANAYQITLTGAVAAAPADTPGGSAGDTPDSSGPQIEQIMPRLYRQVVPILAVAFGILGLGFVLLYRKGAWTGQEAYSTKHERSLR